MHDYSQYLDSPEGGELAQLMELGNELGLASEEVARADVALKRAKAREYDLAVNTIPELMRKIGVKDFTTTNGKRIELGELLAASISEANREAAHRWLEDHGEGGMIKREITVAFNKDQEAAAKELEAKLRDSYPGVKTKEAVHHSTLKAWVAKRLAKGEEVPAAISVERVDCAKIK